MFWECSEGIPAGQDYTWFVEGKEGVVDAIEGLPAERASERNGEASSIAAHVFHVRFGLIGANAHVRGEEPEGTWESSWEKQAMTPDEWADLGKNVREEYALLLGTIEANEDWSDPMMVSGSLAQLPHMAYHLGAIRSLFRATAS